MIYTIERRKISGFGTIDTVYEVMEYDGVYNSGVFYGGKVLSIKKDKLSAEKFLRKMGLRYLYERVKGQDVWCYEKSSYEKRI